MLIVFLRWIELLFSLLAMTVLALSPTAHANGLAVEIGGPSFDQAAGVISVNQAAGDGSQQANLRAIAGSLSGASTATSTSVQGMSGQAVGPVGTMAAIGHAAFHDTTGLVGINQSAGSGNAQANGVVIGLGRITEVTAESVLARTAPNTAGLNDMNRSMPGQRFLKVDPTAFQEAAGIVQVNQAGGAGNASANNFALGIGTKP